MPEAGRGRPAEHDLSFVEYGSGRGLAHLGAQRESGGWCRNLGGHPNCTIHVLRALGSHPELRQSACAERALGFMRRGWKGQRRFAVMQAVAAFDLPDARELIGEALSFLVPRQRKNGTFGDPCRVERVAAVLAGMRALG